MPGSLEDLRAALAGRYEIDREIGHGGMATVYLARDEKHHRQVAVKVLRPELAATIGHERFAREIEISAGLTHPLKRKEARRMSTSRLTALVTLLLITRVTGLAAQDTLVTPGARVRISAPTVAERPLLGTVVALEVDTLIVDAQGYDHPLTLPLASLARLEVSLGQKSRTLKGAGIGFLVGGAAGLATAAIACTIDNCDLGPPPAFIVYLYFGVLGAGVGTLTGAIIGSIIKVDRWLDVPLDLRVSLTPNKRLGLTVSARVAF